MQASQVGSDPGYEDPEPVTAVITIGVAAWNVDVAEIPNHSFSSDLTTFDVAVTESTGTNRGVAVSASPSTLCTVTAVTPPAPVTAGTTSFTATVEVFDPGASAQVFTVTASGLPADKAGGVATDSESFTVDP